jgi:hypothetical protein
MTTIHLNTGGKLSSRMLCISDTLQTMVKNIMVTRSYSLVHNISTYIITLFAAYLIFKTSTAKLREMKELNSCC